MKKFTQLSKSNSVKFKLGIDIHGVIDSAPAIFSFLSHSVINSGGEVHIITGGSWTPQLESMLVEMGIKWTHSCSIYDNLLKTENVTNKTYFFKDGTKQVKFPDEIWNKAKAEYCTKHNISLHIDDTTVYGNFFTTPFARFWPDGIKSNL